MLRIEAGKSVAGSATICDGQVWSGTYRRWPPQSSALESSLRCQTAALEDTTHAHHLTLARRLR